jgi:hypothetical protein
MAGVRKTVGVYERPARRNTMRTALVAAAVAVSAIAAAAIVIF